jgi:hypothetical protein
LPGPKKPLPRTQARARGGKSFVFGYLCRDQIEIAHSLSFK